MLDDDACYRAFCARDGRFDGRIFVGVHTTGIYCRPICPAPPPKRTNVSFFASAVAAQQAGYRPCLRCRPEVSPRFAAWNGSSSTVSRALRLIETGSLDEVGVEAFAARLGVGARQLRRLFVEHVGAPPTAFAQMRRIHLAKQLLQETRISVTEVAHASGYRSVRRFNEAFAAAFGRSPGLFRRAKAYGTGRISLRLGFAPPYDWEGMLDSLGTNAIPGVEAVSSGCYRRTVCEGSASGTICVQRVDERTLKIDVRFPGVLVLPSLLARVRSLFDLGADPAVLIGRFGSDPSWGPCLTANPGVRVSGPWDAFEHVVRTIIATRVDRAVGAGRLRDFSTRYGSRFDSGENGLDRLFPAPAQIAAQDPAHLLPEADAGTAIHAFASAAADERPPLNFHDTLDAAIGRLRALPSFDDRLAERCATGFLHPTDAVGGAGDRDVRYTRWRPWRAYAAALDRLDEDRVSNAA